MIWRSSPTSSPTSPGSSTRPRTVRWSPRPSTWKRSAYAAPSHVEPSYVDPVTSSPVTSGPVGSTPMLTIRLVGPPTIERDGRPAPAPRGRKAWALLSYLVLAERPPSRRHLAELLFGDANDPLGALRWTLAELRRSLGVDAFGGDPVTVRLDSVAVDIDLVRGESAEPL